MRKKIPAPIISILSDSLPDLETHASLDSLFLYADAPGDLSQSDLSKPKKVVAWLREVNKEADEPLGVLGKLIEGYMELPETEINSQNSWLGVEIQNPKVLFKEKLDKTLTQCNLQYIVGGYISDGSASQSKTLRELIAGRNFIAIEAEFNRALENVNANPREAVSAASNILESVCKVYIEDENLDMPNKQDLQSVWRVVRNDLGFDPRSKEDDDVKRILSGVLSVVDGIGALRTHASSAHGQGKQGYKLLPRHARLAVHSAHTITLFILETWDENKVGA